MTDDGLVIEGQLDLDHEPAQVVYEGMLTGRINEFSIAYAIVAEHEVRSKKYGTFQCTRLDELELLEVSVVHAGSNRFTRVLAVESSTGQPLTKRDPEYWLNALAEPDNREPLDVEALLTEVKEEAVRKALDRAKQAAWEREMLVACSSIPCPS